MNSNIRKRMAALPGQMRRLRQASLPVAVVLAIMLAGSTLAAATRVRFRPQVAYEMAGSEPKRIVAQDFDGRTRVSRWAGIATAVRGITAWGLAAGYLNSDNVPDLVLTQGGHDSTLVQIHAGNGDGTFSLLDTTTAGRFPVAVVIGDFNEDTYPDLAVANNVLFGLSVITGTAQGTFGAPSHMPNWANMQATDLAMGDFDGDNHLDRRGRVHRAGAFSAAGQQCSTEAVAADCGDSTLTWPLRLRQPLLINLGTGAGAFAGAAIYTTGSFPRDVIFADMNMDGKQDIVVANQSNNNVAVYLGNGDGTLRSPQTFTTGTQPGAVSAGDWNEDGYPDLAAPYRNLGETPWVSILLQSCCDVTGDGQTTSADIAAVAQAVGDAWNGAPYNGDLDMAPDGVLDVRDVMFVAAHLGSP
ncbi:MAG: VCBS repeat-containing protein [Anaerolineae bacterium]|uniref:FG-GAP-like repeat-containing protein n=1 Tax=Candidatus Amarolinea dominans TaxID=3140696 RepID=UPI003135B5AA|nr:VCBS repeat-containing protein [Anaerolineae bacterium]